MLKQLITAGIDPQRIILGICCASITDAVHLAQFSLKFNCLAALVAPPFFFKGISQEGVITFYRELIQRVGNPALRLILYHIPYLSGVPLNPSIIHTLCREFPNIVIGLKDSEGNLPFMQEAIAQGLKVFAGRDTLLSEAVRAGAAGGILGFTNLFPELHLSLYEYGKHPISPNRNPEMAHIFEAFKEIPIIPALKALLSKKKGPSWNVLRTPLMPMTAHQVQALQSSLKSYLL